VAADEGVAAGEAVERDFGDAAVIRKFGAFRAI
jgi:hypothetical protein